MIICIDWTSTYVTHHQVVAIITQHPKVPASMVGSIAIQVIQEQRYCVIHHSTFREAAIVTTLLQDGVANDPFLQVAHRVLRIGAFENVLHGVFTLFNIVGLGNSHTLLVFVHIKQALTCGIILVHLGILLVGRV